MSEPREVVSARARMQFWMMLGDMFKQGYTAVRKREYAAWEVINDWENSDADKSD